jgi:hypothetical protein
LAGKLRNIREIVEIAIFPDQVSKWFCLKPDLEKYLPDIFPDQVSGKNGEATSKPHLENYRYTQFLQNSYSFLQFPWNSWENFYFGEISKKTGA